MAREDGGVAKELLDAHRLLPAAAQGDVLRRLVDHDPVRVLARVLAHEDDDGARPARRRLPKGVRVKGRTRVASAVFVRGVEVHEGVGGLRVHR